MSAGLVPTRWHVFATVDELQRAVVAEIVAAADNAVQTRSVFSLVLAGGTTPRGVYGLLRDALCDWPAWQIYFGDERCAPRHDPDRNSRMAREAWLDHVPMPACNVHVIPAELGAVGGAEAYAHVLHGVGMFDLVLLGLGEDGHTASLFPGHDWDGGAKDVIAVLDAPKPPPERVSLSAARLSHARKVMFLVAGEGKRDAVRRWHAGEPIPARAITPRNGVDVLLDRAADQLIL
jgi:6-phosphogluconolactonase